MRRLPAAILFSMAVLAPLATAHGDLEVNELETLAIRDFEGMEDSFPWEGFEIWDVYVGEGYNDSYDIDGVYFKVNLAGDGTQRPLGGAIWSLNFQFKVDEEAFEREIMHDGASVTTTFESLQWMVADGNVFQVKAWAPVPNIKGRNVTDITIVSAVDGEPRDSAPGGVHTPGAGAEAPVSGPGTPIFPPIGEGRVVDAVPLTGPEKFIELELTPLGEGKFGVRVTNPLEEQGQHVILTADPAAGWDMNTTSWGGNLDGKASTEWEMTLIPRASASSVAPLRVDILTDIGGHRTLYAFMGETGVEIVDDPALAATATMDDGSKDTPTIPVALLLTALLAIALARRRK